MVEEAGDGAEQGRFAEADPADRERRLEIGSASPQAAILALEHRLEGLAQAHGDLQALLEATDTAILLLDPSMRIVRFTPGLARLFDLTPADEGRPIAEVTDRLGYDDLAGHAGAVLRDQAPTEHEVASRSGGWFLVRMRPHRAAGERIDGVVATFTDITERRRAEEALRAGVAKLRQEQRLFELSRAPMLVWDVEGGIIRWNRGSAALYGYATPEALGRMPQQLLATVVPGASPEAVRAALLAAGTWTGEQHHRAKDGRLVMVESQIELVSSGGRTLVLEASRDVTEQRLWEQRRELLLGELAHRMKNTLAVVQAMARQTLRTTESSTDFIERFEGRLTGLEAAHRLLFDSRWEGADLATLARGQLEAYSASGSDRLRIEGASIILPPDLATPFGLVLHELATNAAKYGAFATPEGHVDLKWTLAGADGRRLAVLWTEHGGLPVTVPTRTGFGGTLIENAIPGATVERRFRPSGLECAIELELPGTGREGEAEADGRNA